MVSMSKIVSDFGTTLFPSLLFGWVPAHVAPFPPASARFAHSRALFSFDPSPRQQNTSSLVRQLRAKPEADRRTTQLKETPLRFSSCLLRLWGLSYRVWGAAPTGLTVGVDPRVYPLLLIADS